MTEATATIQNYAGIHARPALLFVQTASSFVSKVQIKAKGRTVDAKSILMIMAMSLSRGTEITIVADGPDEAEAVNALKALIDSKFGEEGYEEEQEPVLTVQDYLKMADKCFVSGDYREAIENYSAAIELEEDCAVAYNNRSYAYVKLEEYDKAISDAGCAVRLQPDEANYYDTLGCAYMGLKNYSKAIEAFDQAITLNPNFAEAYYNRGLCRQAQSIDDSTKAQDDFNKAKTFGYIS
ncbi:MAG: HPr family phosphocarrier protein [Selenomonadaceae bacterium]|nr:HPr family phosphocarrier protein [Selenomonadaceae bacterium]MBQ9498250.1 HPr family phosphocarrier protein [Selenomonadaceae bacterium]